MRSIILAFLLSIYLVLSSPADLFPENFSLEWDKVTTDTSGAPLTELTGYKVYVSGFSQKYGLPAAIVEPVASGTIESYVYSNFISGRYYFVVTAFNSSGESLYSNEVFKDYNLRIPGTPLNFRSVN